MPERFRSIVNGLRRFVGERRHAPRHPARLPVEVSLVGPVGKGAARALSGYTRDLSATGLGFVVPAIRVGERYLMGEGKQIQITIKLPGGTVSLRAAPVRYERLDEDAGEAGYLVGAHVTEMGDEDRARLDEYLKVLSRGEGRREGRVAKGVRSA